MTLQSRIEEIRKRLEKWQDELPKLIQPGQEHVQNIADIALLLRVVEVQREALKTLGDEIHGEHCDEDWHCNWCEQILIVTQQADAIAGEGE